MLSGFELKNEVLSSGGEDDCGVVVLQMFCRVFLFGVVWGSRNFLLLLLVGQEWRQEQQLPKNEDPG